MAGEVFIDASLFMGMHSKIERIRRACAGFFVRRFGEVLVMSLEQVGKCDDMVWRFPREIQDAYYPFMDNLHTDMRIERAGYREEDVRAGLSSSALRDLPISDRLLLGTVIRRDAVLHTVNPWLRGRDLPVVEPPTVEELAFPGDLERMYQESLVLRVAEEEV